MRRRGFTLMEVLVASVVLTLGVILALQGVAGAFGASSRIDRRRQGEALAADILNRVAAGEAQPTDSGTALRDGLEYEWGLTAEPQSAGLSMLTCQVCWPQGGDVRSIEISRLIVDAGEVGP